MLFQRILLSVLVVSYPVVDAFSPSTSSIQQSVVVRRVNKQLVKKPTVAQRTTSNHLKLFPDPAALSDCGSFGDLVSTHLLLSDAAIADAAAPKELGWWGSYLQLFKTTLIFVHSTIDQPLRSVGITQTWGISIALFTAGIRSLLVPLSVQQNKNSEYMKALKPYMDEIKTRFKDDEDTKNRAMGKLLSDANQNPLSGCLVSLFQLPIFLGLYRGVRLLALDGVIDEPFLWIPSLQGPVSPPDFRDLEWLTTSWTAGTDGGLPIPQLGWETTLAFLAMPLILVLLQSFTMSTLQPPTDDMTEEDREQTEKTQVVFKFLPLLIGFFSLQVPAGLTIYWFTSNLFTLTQSLAVKAYFAANPPDIELPDYWDSLSSKKDASEMTPDELRGAVKAGLKVGPTFDELVDDARFYCLIERSSLRKDSPAWSRVADEKSASVPEQFKSWVSEKPVVDDVSSPSTPVSAAA